MGCTSAKPKRTTSIEDVASKQPQNASQVPDKNGQLNKGPDKDKILREKQSNETNAVEIPGAHKSFMAPDGIPFIDEDAESEPGDVQLVNGNDGKNVKRGSPDQNKNIAIVANKEAKMTAITSAPGLRTSALEESAHAGNAGLQKNTVIDEPTVISQIKTKEIQVTTTTNQQSEATTEVQSRTTLMNCGPDAKEEIAATKIQAGIRGYLGRQKVKAIRANKQHPIEANEKHDGNAQQNSGPEVTKHTVEERIEWNSDDPKLDAAATKIQANYKGYRTRKEIKTAHSK